jgi:hypothetical protein
LHPNRVSLGQFLWLEASNLKLLKYSATNIAFEIITAACAKTDAAFFFCSASSVHFNRSFLFDLLK